MMDMTLTERASEGFYAWACENEDRNIYPEMSKDVDSYFEDRTSEETYIMEYPFKTMEGLRCGLERYSGLSEDPEMLKKLTITICEERYRRKTAGARDQSVPDDKDDQTKAGLPDFVYVF